MQKIKPNSHSKINQPTEMEVLIPMAPTNFNFESVGSTPFSSVPSSPKVSGDVYFSAPTSPSRPPLLYRDISFVERTPNSTAITETYYEDEDDQGFAFDFSGQLEKPSSTADELFDQGRIRPLETLKKSPVFTSKTPKQEQGRERVSELSSKSKHRSSRSLSDFVFGEEEEEESTQAITTTSNSKSSYYYDFFTKWKLKDFILFRSASEGRADEKDPLRKYTATISKKQQEVKNSSFRSTDSSSSSAGSRRRRPVSALELHYKPNKPAQNELKRRTYLPYTQGLLGCVGFNPTLDGLAKGLNSFTRR